MKEKFLQFFTGKMSKAIYISIAAAVVCGAVVITSTVVVHNNNQKIDSVLESLSASESVAESVTETAAESISVTENVDKALQYLAEYDKLTAEYQGKRDKLLISISQITQAAYTASFFTTDVYGQLNEADSIAQAEYESQIAEQDKRNAEADEKTSQIQKKIDALDAQYEKDVAALKARYGIE